MRLSIGNLFFGINVFVILGCTGPQGPPGPPGPQGPPGQQGLLGYETVESVTTKDILTLNDVISGKAECPSGKRILGGGGFTLHELQSGELAGQDVRAFMPVELSEPVNNSWSLTVRNARSSTLHNVRLHVIAICADVAP